MLWVLSLVMSVAVVVLWGRSYFRAYSINRAIALGDRLNGEERETFIVSNKGWFFVATNWQGFHYERNSEPARPAKQWMWLSFPPPDNYKPPAYFPMNYQGPTSQRRSSGFDARIISVGHFVMHGTYKTDWTNRVTWAMTVPHWLVALMFLIPPGIALRRRLKARKRQRMVAQGKCPHCRYDLRESGERCPECGKPVERRGVEVAL
jgi:hypothetical protein